MYIIFDVMGGIGLETANGNYTACSLKENKKWELYDDTKIKSTTDSHE